MAGYLRRGVLGFFLLWLESTDLTIELLFIYKGKPVKKLGCGYWIIIFSLSLCLLILMIVAFLLF